MGHRSLESQFVNPSNYLPTATKDHKNPSYKGNLPIIMYIIGHTLTVHSQMMTQMYVYMLQKHLTSINPGLNHHFSSCVHSFFVKHPTQTFNLSTKSFFFLFSPSRRLGLPLSHLEPQRLAETQSAVQEFQGWPHVDVLMEETIPSDRRIVWPVGTLWKKPVDFMVF